MKNSIYFFLITVLFSIVSCSQNNEINGVEILGEYGLKNSFGIVSNTPYLDIKKDGDHFKFKFLGYQPFVSSNGSCNYDIELNQTFEGDISETTSGVLFNVHINKKSLGEMTSNTGWDPIEEINIEGSGIIVVGQNGIAELVLSMALTPAVVTDPSVPLYCFKSNTFQRL